MKSYPLSHLADHVVLHDLATLPDPVESPAGQLVLERVTPPSPQFDPEQVTKSDFQLAAERVEAPGVQVSSDPVDLTKLTPLSPGWFELEVIVDQETHDLLRYVQSLLGESLAPDDISGVLKLSLDWLVQELEQKK